MSLPSPADAAVARRARITLLLSVVVTIALYAVPYGWYAAYPLMLISTVVHEMGHGIAALLAGGNFIDFHMWRDGSGIAAHSAAPSHLGNAFVCAGGLCGPALLAGIFLFLGRRPGRARWVLGAFGAFLAVCLVLWVRGSFGMMFVGGLAAVCLVVAVKGGATLSQHALVFLAVQLALSVFARGDYLFMQFAQTGAGLMPSDVQQMSNALALPYWFWGGLCAAFSGLCLLAGGWSFLRGGRAAPPAVKPAVRAELARAPAV